MSDGSRPDDASPGGQAANLFIALLLHVFVGLPWLAGTTAFSFLIGENLAVVWGLAGFALWALGAADAVRSRAALGAVWGAVLRSWLRILVAPVALAVVGIRRLPEFWPSAPLEPVEEPVNPHVARRLNDLARRIAELSRELDEVRRIAEAGDQPAAAPPPVMWEPRQPAPAPPPEPKPAPSYTPPPPPEPAEPSFWQRDIDYGALLGAKGLAWAGGIVTVLGVVFFFVLAVNRGWIGPEERVALGALASAFVFGGGLFLHQRYGPVYSAYSAVGAGLAGGYATLLAATALYELVPDLVALGIAGAIAAVGVATALYWSSELIAGIGLVGATLVPLMVLFEEDISPIGTGFAGLVFAATAAVAVVNRWPSLLGAGFAASAPQIAMLVGDGAITDWDRVVLGWLFTALYVGAAYGLHRVLDDDGLHGLSGTLVLAAGLLAGATAGWLFDGDEEGWMVVGTGAAFAALAAALFPHARDRDFSALVAAVALALAAVGFAMLLSGPSLAIAWAAEAAVLAWLAQRIDEPRYQLAALAYLAAAAVHAVAIDAPPTDLYREVADPADGALAPLSFAIAAVVVALYSREWLDVRPGAGFFSVLEPVMAPVREFHFVWRSVAGWLAGAGALYAASLAVLELAQLVWNLAEISEFQRGHVAVTALWGAGAAGLAYGARWFATEQVRTAGLVLAGLTTLQAVTFNMTFAGDRRGWALLAAGVPLLLTAFAEERPALEGRTGSSPWALLLAVGSAALGTAGLLFVAEGSVGPVDAEGAAWLGLAGVYALLAALVFRADREFSTSLWAPALAVGALAAAELVSGTWLVLAWSAVAAGVAVLGGIVDEERLHLGAAGYLTLALGYTLVELAPPDEFFSANDDPAVGVPALAFSLGALVVVASFGLRAERVARYRIWAFAGAAVLGIYAVSLAILGLFEWIGAASVETDFQRGHSAVSTFWGIIGLVTLYVGLTRDLRPLRLAGFALFGLALTKLFLYDLANLSSVTRALSFLGVGAVLLIAGFFYQRLTAATREA